MIIGICGKSCSGKSTLSDYLIQVYKDKAAYLEIDKIGHKALEIEEVQRELVNCFGDSVLDGGVVNRKRLGDIVFSSRHEMDKLTAITWGYMQGMIDEFINENKDKLIILDWILLPQTKYAGMCNLKVLFDIPYEVRLKRAIARDGISEEDFLLRESASIDYDATDFDIVLKDNEMETIKGVIRKL